MLARIGLPSPPPRSGSGAKTHGAACHRLAAVTDLPRDGCRSVASSPPHPAPRKQMRKHPRPAVSESIWHDDACIDDEPRVCPLNPHPTVAAGFSLRNCGPPQAKACGYRGASIHRAGPNAADHNKCCRAGQDRAHSASAAGSDWRDDDRLVARALERADQPGAENGDIPRAVRGENPSRSGRHGVQALSSWKRGMATSNAVPSSSTIR